jgi:hypothetical protein
MNNFTFGDSGMGYYETIAGGAGAGPSWHGRSGVHTHMTNTRITGELLCSAVCQNHSMCISSCLCTYPQGKCVDCVPCISHKPFAASLQHTQVGKQMNEHHALRCGY